MEAESKQSGTTTTNWTATQTYAMAAVCLLIGVLVGYLVRGSAKPAAQASASFRRNAAGRNRAAVRRGTTEDANPG